MKKILAVLATATAISAQSLVPYNTFNDFSSYRRRKKGHSNLLDLRKPWATSRI